MLYLLYSLHDLSKYKKSQTSCSSIYCIILNTEMIYLDINLSDFNTIGLCIL